MQFFRVGQLALTGLVERPPKRALAAPDLSQLGEAWPSALNRIVQLT
jgi:hypothetical protein